MKVLVAVLVACLVMSVSSQSANSAASTGGLAAAAGTQGRGLLGGNMMGLALMSGQLGDGMQRLMQCQMLGIPTIMCMSM